MPDPLADLQRRAYGRPLSEADAAEARAQLQGLALGDGDARPVAPVRLPAVASVVGKGTLLLAAATVGLAIIATGIALAPRPSLDVFAAPQSGVPVWPGARANDDIRWLGSIGQWTVFAFMRSDGNVCMSAVAGGNSGSGSCTSLSEFQSTGLTLETSTFVGTGRYLSVTWGPLGAAHLDDSPR